MLLGKPTISELQQIRTVNGNEIKVIEELASSYVILGDLMEFDNFGLVVNLIRENNKQQPQECCRAILQHWMSGCGKVQCSWQSLVDLITKCGKESLADEIRAVILQ